ncbi:hypothetical protein RB595_009101 [Gaeumannomyces hyphopodioides]
MSTPDTSPPTSSPGLVADLVCRTVLAVVANVAIWVPFRLLWKNGEFAATLLCGVVMLMNTIYFVNALIWRDDDTAGWYDGTGWCDLQAYIIVPLRTLYAACIMVIMRHLARQLNLARVSGLTHAEKRRRNLVQAAIVFPLPLLQVALTYPVLQTRYAIMPLLGCEPYFTANPLSLTFFFLAQPVFCVGALIYAVLAFKRFREIKKTTDAVHSNNSSVASRANRTKRKLYGMTLSILLPYAILIFVFMYRNIRSEDTWAGPYSFSSVQDSPLWNKVLYVTSAQAGFPRLQLNYVAILTAVPIFFFFGTSSEAINTWRCYLLALGLGRVFPGLKEEYDPDRPRKGGGSSAARNPHSLQSWAASTLSADRKQSLAKHHEQPLSTPSPNHKGSISRGDAVPPSAGVASTHSQLPIVSHDDDEIQLPRRVPWLFRTTLATPLKMPPLSFPKFGRHKGNTPPSSASATAMAEMPPRPSDSGSLPGAAASGGQGRGRPLSRDDGLHAGHQQQPPARWEQSPTGSAVETRVWSSEPSLQRPAAAAAGGRTQHGATGWDQKADPVHPGVRVQTDIATRSLHRASMGSLDEEAAGHKGARGWGV